MTLEMNDIDRQAAEWVARTDGVDLSVDEQAALAVWLGADERHLGAYLRAHAIALRAERLLKTDKKECEQRLQARPIRRRTILAGTVAASLLAVVIGGDLIWRHAREAVYSTKLGETRAIALSDGSVITLNTESKAAVRYTETRRTIMLMQGEALFDVAKNKSRPFVVETRGVQVRAVGTSFSILSLPDRPLGVLVREGTVKIDHPGGQSVLVHANTQATVFADGSIKTRIITPAKVARNLAWMTGHICFQHQTLASAAREFARYSKMQIIVADPAVANRTITGVYRSNDPAGFAEAVAVSLGLNAQIGDNEVRLSRKPLSAP